MGRFYQTPQAPQFIDGLYTPPWELMDKALSTNQQGYDNALATTNLFEGIDINGINDPIVKDQINNIKKYYEDKSNQITKAIQANPMDWKKSKISIQNLGKELQEDMKNGSIARIQKAHESMQNFIKEHEEYAKKNPGLFNQGYDYYLKEYQKDPLRMGNFNWENLANPIDIEKLNKRLADMVADAKEQPDGDWKVGIKTVSKDRILEAARSQIYGEPENKAFIEQQIKFRNPDYYNERYAKATGGNGFYEQMYLSNNEVDETGNPKVLTNEEVTRREKEYLESVEKYVKDRKAGKKDVQIPQRDYSVKKGAIGNLLDGAVNEHSYTQQSADINAVKFAKANLALSQGSLELQKAKNEIDNKYKQIEALSKQADRMFDFSKMYGNNITYYLNAKSPEDIAQRDALIKSFNDAVASYDLIDSNISKAVDNLLKK